MSMWSLRWHYTNKSVAGAPYSIKGYSLSHSWTLVKSRMTETVRSRRNCSGDGAEWTDARKWKLVPFFCLTVYNGPVSFHFPSLRLSDCPVRRKRQRHAAGLLQLGRGRQISVDSCCRRRLPGKHSIPLSLSTCLNSSLTIFHPDPCVLPIQITLPNQPVLLATTFPLGPFLCLHLLLIGTLYPHTFVLSIPYPPLNDT